MKLICKLYFQLFSCKANTSLPEWGLTYQLPSGQVQVGFVGRVKQLL